MLGRALALAGLTLAELAQRLAVALPGEPRRDKGFIGRLLERALLVVSDSAAVQDFPELGVELKTLPVDVQGRPRESTFVCHIDLGHIAETEWEQSRVNKKLERVLFVPIESAPHLRFGARRIGAAWLWSPSVEESALLRADYDELAGRIGRGEIDSLGGRTGIALQLRPKAAHGGIHTRAVDAQGEPVRAQPRAFYLRASFTGEILRRNLALASGNSP